MNKKGFTLIELLAVIIILGILMIIAIPSVTKYISDSRKSSYIDTAREIIGGARNMVNDGRLGMFDTNSTYYIPVSCIKTENASKSPYGEFTKAYIGVIYDGKGYKYYWISVDDAGQGVRNITPLDKLDTDDIESDLQDSDIEGVVTTTGIGSRSEIKILNCSTNTFDRQYHIDDTSHNVSEENGGESSSENTPSNIVCKPATTLHTAICNKSDAYGCNAEGQVGNGNTITYGTIVSGSPKAGDAYDCKVRIDGGYTERFYYIGSDGDNSILIYYKNMNDQTKYAYDSSGENYHGPRTGYQYLPSKDEWNNPRLIAPGTRSIKTESTTYPNTTNNGSNSIESFTYTNKAARFLTYQEVKTACKTTTIPNNGSLGSCIFLMENIGYYEKDSGTRSYGYWLETPCYSNFYYTFGVWGLSGGYLRVDYSNADKTTYGVRPVITIKTTDLG